MVWEIDLISFERFESISLVSLEDLTARNLAGVWGRGENRKVFIVVVYNIYTTMAFIRKIKTKSGTYLAEVEGYRKDGKVKQRVIKYLGKEIPLTGDGRDN